MGILEATTSSSRWRSAHTDASRLTACSDPGGGLAGHRQRTVADSRDDLPAVITLPLPSRMDGANLRFFVQRFIDACQYGMPSDVYIDFQPLSWIEPAGITFLSNFVHWLHSRGIRSFFCNHDKASASSRFLDDSLFFEQHIGCKINLGASPRSTTVHLQRVGHERSHAWVRLELVPWLSAHTGKAAPSFHPLQVCVSELFNNIQDHTDNGNGSIFIQRFPKKDTISISIADFGVGIPDRVRSLRPGLSDNQALLEAVRPGFTTKTKPQNRGAGLDYLLQTVVAANGGYVRIYSLSGYALFYPYGAGLAHMVSDLSGFCPGTTIELLIRTDRIAEVEDASEELSW